MDLGSERVKLFRSNLFWNIDLIASQLKDFVGNARLKMSSTADVILYGGSIITMDEKNPSAEALAVTGNLITAVGKLDEVFALAGETTKVIYLNQKTLLPGFIG